MIPPGLGRGWLFPICGRRRQCARCNSEKILLCRGYGGKRGGAGADSFKIGGHTALLFRPRVTEESIQIQGACIHRDRNRDCAAIPLSDDPGKAPARFDRDRGGKVLHSLRDHSRLRAESWPRAGAGARAEPRSIGIKNSNVKQTGAARRRWRTAETFPRVQSDVMMISPSRNKRCFCPPALHQLKPEHAA